MTSIQVNTTETGNQVNPSIATFSSDHPALAGGYVVVFEDQSGADGSGSGIYGQLYNANGQPVGGEFLISDKTAGDQSLPSAAVLDNGNILISWY
ncbi:hypothetical protein MF542_17480, partial [Kordiimonas sp. 5E331]